MGTSNTTLIVIAFGVEVRDWPKAHGSLINFLDSLVKQGKATVKSPGVWVYYKERLRRYFEIRVVYTKDEFRAALNMEDAIVIYSGHSHYGQGPAFGPSGLSGCPESATYPVNPWENHFQMGYDVAMIPCGAEIFKHCTNPTEYSQKIPSKDFFASDNVKEALKVVNKGSEKCQQEGYARRALLKCHEIIANLKNGQGVQSLKNRHYWEEKKAWVKLPPEFKRREFNTIVNAGSADLQTVQLKCKVLYMDCCDSQFHYAEALQRRKKATKSRCCFYLTSRTFGDVPTEKVFLEQVLHGLNPSSRRGSLKILNRLNHGIGWHKAGDVFMEC